AFESPENPTDSPAAAENHNFPLYANKEAADAATYTRRVPMVAMFNGSVADLKRGAPVTLHGIKIGEVSSVNLSYDRTLDVVVVPVHFEVEPERIEELHLPTGGGLDNVIRDLVHHGLQVRIESTSLITGQKQLALEFAQGATSAEYAKLGDTYVIPAAEGSGDLATEASTLLSRVNAIPFEQIGEDLSTATAGLSQRVNDPQLKEAVASLQETLTDARELVQRLNSASEPLLQRMPAIARDLESATRRLNSLAGSLESGYGGNSELNRNASRMLVQLTDAAQSIRVLADLLSRHPEALLRGRTAGGLP
ncbi:MAG: MCE family protein, partial [Acetobacteraceae bacterium]|nr:MCE family protein [Acetobacteraceae bacterium]